MKQLIITGPDRILYAIRDLVDSLWDADHRGEQINQLECEMADTNDEVSDEK